MKVLEAEIGSGSARMIPGKVAEEERGVLKIQILKQLPAESELNDLVQLINDVYDVAEDGMWKDKGVRTTAAEVQSLIEQERLIVAIDLETKRIVGCTKVDRIQKKSSESGLDAETIGEFGMLVVDPAVRRQGIGKRLIQAAEEWSVQQGFAEMQLELLTPRHWKHPTKEFNKIWYSRLGYVPLRTEAFDKDYPGLVPMLATECDFTVWRKPLVSSGIDAVESKI